jgi:hypothetical protein
VHLNVVRSIRLIVGALQEAEAYASSQAPIQPDDPVYPALTPELLTLKMRLLPLQQVEEALLGKLTPGAKLSKAYTAMPDDSPSPSSTLQEVSVHSAAPWKGAFSRLMNNVRSSVDGPEVNEPQDSRDARQLLHACSEDMIRLWNDPTVKEVLKAHRLRLEDMAGLCVAAFYSTAYYDRPAPPLQLPRLNRARDSALVRTHGWYACFATALTLRLLTSPSQLDDILKARLKTLGSHHSSLSPP